MIKSDMEDSVYRLKDGSILVESDSEGTKFIIKYFKI